MADPERKTCGTVGCRNTTQAAQMLRMSRDDPLHPLEKNPVDFRRAVRTSVIDLLGESKIFVI